MYFLILSIVDRRIGRPFRILWTRWLSPTALIPNVESAIPWRFKKASSSRSSSLFIVVLGHAVDDSLRDQDPRHMAKLGSVGDLLALGDEDRHTWALGKSV